MTLDEEDLAALLVRSMESPDRREIEAVVEEVRRARRATRYEPMRTHIMLMASAIGAELARDVDFQRYPKNYETVAEQSVRLALAIEKATPRP